MPPAQWGHSYCLILFLARECFPRLDKDMPGYFEDFENATPNPKAMNANPMRDAKIRKNNGGDPKLLKGVVHIEINVTSPMTPKMANMIRKNRGKPGVM